MQDESKTPEPGAAPVVEVKKITIEDSSSTVTPDAAPSSAQSLKHSNVSRGSIPQPSTPTARPHRTNSQDRIEPINNNNSNTPIHMPLRRPPRQYPMYSAFSLVIQPHNATRVIKGEIHNVLTVMRADRRYVSNVRFEEELLEGDEHPLLVQFRDLHATICEWESSPQEHLPDALVYLPPFCAAIKAREISASITGAALSALHKFLLYGFILPETANAQEGMTLISQSLLSCTFEESSAIAGGGHGGETSEHLDHSVGFNVRRSSTDTNIDQGVAFTVRRSLSGDGRSGAGNGSLLQHGEHSSGGVRGGRSRATVVATMLMHDDEQVVLKLLELSALVVRCSLNHDQPLISTDLIVGLLDTCLHVSHRAKRASLLLKSAAADALGQIVLQVFSTDTHFGTEDDDDDSSKASLERISSGPSSGTKLPKLVKISPLLEARTEILSKLSSLLNPQQHSDATCATSLTLVNIAFETLREDFVPEEIAILQNDFCKYLLQWSTTHDLIILNLTLRVIFNLFQSMRNHLKVPLEVFLTSVHLRILDPTSSATNEEREVALESLLEFCQEVALMQDIYLNYDCDISCTNLYEAICKSLGRVACSERGGAAASLSSAAPPGSIATSSTDTVSITSASTHADAVPSTPRVRPSKVLTGEDMSTIGDETTSSAHHYHALQTHFPLNILNRLALEAILAILDSIFRRCQSHLRYEDYMAAIGGEGGGNQLPAGESFDGTRSDDGTNNVVDINTPTSQRDLSNADEIGVASRWQTAPAELSEEVLQERKIMKHLLARMASAFNEDPFGDSWIEIAKDQKILPPTSHETVLAADVAELLYSTHGLDKANIGIYLSKGPKEKYPFHAEVLQHFVQQFDFSDETFAGAVRRFLAKFRLPGEAQCIDRLMDAFSKELYKQFSKRKEELDKLKAENKKQVSGDESGDDGDIEDGGDKEHRYVFKNADAVFVLSFSTIMLNTDLHNPSMKKNRRMTLEQFIKNNRGINDGEDLPEEFLTELYEQIKTKEIQVQAEVGEFLSMTKSMMNTSSSGTKSGHDSFRATWDSVVANRSRNVAEAFFTPAYAARQSIERAGVHDKEMFVTLSNSALQGLSNVFCRSWDDALVVKALRGLKQMVKMCDFFETKQILNEILQILLRLGRDYIMGCTALEYAGYDHGAPILPNGRMPMAVLGEDNDESRVIDTESPIPTGVLCTPKGVDPLHASFAVHAGHNLLKGSADAEDEEQSGLDDGESEGDTADEVDVTGSAAHRGLLALDCAFVMLRNNASAVRDAWPAFIGCICALRDARGLPTGLSDLDDFADSNGNVLPLSNYAQMSQKRLDDYYRVMLGKKDKNENKGWLRNLWGQKKAPQESPALDDSDKSNESEGGAFISPSMKEELSSFAVRLLDVSDNCEVEKIVVQMGSCSSEAAGGVSDSQHEQIHDDQQFFAIQSLLSIVDEYPYEDDPVLEQHAIFSLELAARALLTNREKAPELFNLFLIQFESILSKVDDNKIPAPFMVERVVVTILRSSIHLYDLPELRPHLRASLHLLMMSLPRKFIAQISDRMACGLAIILRASFHYFETPNEWTFMGDTLDMLANYSAARGFVFDGIASTVEYALPSTPEDAVSGTHESASTLTFDKDDDSHPQNPPSLSKDACLALTRILIRFVLGFYQSDLSLSVPAMLCLEKVYRHLVSLMIPVPPPPPEIKEVADDKEKKNGTSPSPGHVPDKELWQNVVVSVYSVCRSVDEESSTCGRECYERLMKETTVEEVPDDKWLAILYLMVNKQPQLAAVVPRANTFAVLGMVVMMVLPPLSHRSENWEDLTDLIQQIAGVAAENLREGRQGSFSPIFNTTVKAVTEISNMMMTEDVGGDKEFSTWASETLLAELEKVGAGGGHILNVKATTTDA